MSPNPRRRRGEIQPNGQIRQSQVVTSFGPGAMIDMPEQSVLVAGLEHWTGYEKHPIIEDRLAGKVKKLLGRNYVFYAPPADTTDPMGDITGITVWLFPEWFISPTHETRDPKTGVRSRPLVSRMGLDKGLTYRPDRNAKKGKVVPIRFVQACTRGHVSDIDWRVFVHGKGSDCSRNLWLDEKGTTGDLTDITVRCECGATKALSAATKINDAPLGYCNGPRPWLGGFAQEPCGKPGESAQLNRLLIRAASNAYFSQTLSAISIPEPGAALRAAVEEVWVDFLSSCEGEEDVARDRKKPKVKIALEGFTDEQVWAEIERRKAGAPPIAKGIREAEIETLLESPDQMGEDVPEGVFFARTMKKPAGEPELLAPVTRIVKVHRLREVIVQVGFTRFEAAVPDVNGELALDVERAALSREADWLPAVENRGEGIFVGFSSDAIEAWASRPEVKARAAQLKAGFDAWKANRSSGKNLDHPGVEYVMLHTLAHLLITAVALDCGYAASSIRERIYAGNSGYGILLYTASPDAEGTLGGLVEAADRIDRYMRQAVDLGRLCSNDPVCAQHQPDNKAEDRLLSGAACHGCVLLAESSCERRNDFLDRALVVPTVDGDGTAFFDVD